MKSAIEIHDSNLSAIEQHGQATTLRLAPAVVHRSEGEPGVDSGTEWLQDVVISIENSNIGTAEPTLPADLSDGKLTIDNNELSNVMPIPLHDHGAVLLELVTQRNEKLFIKGSSIVIEAAGRARYLQQFTP